ncbi:replication restart DNA helicase PriA [Pilibacter termitis]|uniref:Replication restart protein PriA n=1 Tax=Pilibacter termitis TaxID=263852 RepID=A0A1T4PX73_9ENTE|nr:primosomal protein N' [Pilibacter termitis]SJZ96103.1 replication restart DNA helicase PriA [Pilibacter termitis]
MFAEVIVDVPAFQTDMPYTYRIPKEFEQDLMCGMRVHVPFGNGNRLIMGFVVGFQDECDLEEIKEIQEVLDIAPVLNEELLSLADFMKNSTFSFKISCMQTMLPAMLKSKYEKFIIPTDESASEYFNGKPDLSFKEVQENGQLPLFLRLRKEGLVDLKYLATSKETIKTERMVRLLLSSEELSKELANVRVSAKQQKRLLEFFSENERTIFSAKELSTEGISSSTLKTAQDKKWVEIFAQEVRRNPFKDAKILPTSAMKLNAEQKIATEKILQAADEENSKVFLLEGITGSGKTEVYLQVIANVLEQGKTAMMLVPEISLTPQMASRFKSRFGDDVAVLHSALSMGEKYDEWRRVEAGKAKVVVGARSAVFAPLENIGVIIIDEEHEAVYKQDNAPRYHARDIAIWRGIYHHCPVVLGSATPSLESRARAYKNVYELLLLTQRAVNGAQLPNVEVVDFREEFGQSGTNIYTKRLLERISEVTSKGEQAVLLLNRRGFSSFMLCRDCGFVLKCPNCDISLTLHMDTKTMRCHYCGHEEGIPNSCGNCNSKRIRYYGTGTQKAEQELLEHLPHLRILRMDVDTTRKKGAHEKLLERFGNKEADVLLGTQMIAKGLDFENVTLVGVLNADTGLNLPDFRASERTFQLLTQVAGRAGRGQKQGEVLIQTYNPTHYAIEYAKKQDYEDFYRKEMGLRHLAGYPPFYFTVQITASHKEENLASKAMYEIFLRIKQSLSDTATVLGPSPKSIARVNNQYFYQLLIKYKKEERLEIVLKEILEEMQQESLRGLTISIDREPLSFM